MTSTFTALINRVITRLSLVSGTGIQLYAEDRVGEMIQHKFDILFDELFWPQFSTWAQWTLDGTNGVVTTDLTDLVKRLEDIQVILPGTSSRGITTLPIGVNPFQLSGTTPIHYEASTSLDKVFHVWPKTATGTLAVHFRTKPDPFTGEDPVNFDEQLLILGATYDFLEDDGSNPASAAKFEKLFESRRRQVLTNMPQVVSLTPGQSSEQTEWREA